MPDVTVIDAAPIDAAPVARAIETSDRVASHLHPSGSLAVADHPTPNGREEMWRFTPLRRLRGLHADAVFQPAATRCEVNQPAGASVRTVEGEELAAWRGFAGYVPTDRTSARIYAEVPTSLVVDIAPNAELAEPVVVDLTGTDVAVIEAGHVAVRFGAHSTGTVILRHTGSATLAQVVELLIGDGAQATIVSVQDWADDTVHLVQHHVRVGRDAALRHIAVSLGGDLVRMNNTVEYAGPGGRVEMFGLYFADAGQHLEHRLFVDHNAPQTHSNVDYRGALQGKGAHSVWVGDVLIRKIAENISTYESNKNLVLTEGCRADSVPNLEIETGQIEGAGHSSTTGRFDDEQLFYLRSRGITEEEARRLVVRGFFADIIRRIGVAEIEERMMVAIEAELAHSLGAFQ